MDSLQVSGSITLSGQATGTAAHPDNNAPFFLRLIAALSSTDTGAAKATTGLYYADRSLSAGATETFDLTSFSDALEEAGSTMSKVRVYVVWHSDVSLASSIRVGGAGTPFAGIKDTASGTDTLVPNAGFMISVPTTAGMAVTAGSGVKILNLDGANAATYSIGVFGE